MGRMDGDGIDCAGETRTIEGWRQECERFRGRAGELELEVQRLERVIDQLQEDRDKAEGESVRRYNEARKALFANGDLRAKIDKLEAEREKWLNTGAEQDKSIVGRGYRSVTVYADGTVEIDRSSDDDDQPASRRAL